MHPATKPEQIIRVLVLGALLSWVALPLQAGSQFATIAPVPARPEQSAIDPANIFLERSFNFSDSLSPTGSSANSDDSEGLQAAPAASADIAWAGGFGFPGLSSTTRSVKAVATDGGQVYAGGTNLVSQAPVARWDGTNWHAMGGASPLAAVMTLVADGEQIYAGGYQLAFDGNDAARVVLWDGTRWRPMEAGLGEFITSGGVERLALLDGKLYAVAVSPSGHYVARWDGGTWHQVGASIGLLSGPFDLALWDDKLLLLQGGVLYQQSGDSWQIIFRGAGSFETVTALAASGGRLVVAGFNTSLGGYADGVIAQWNGTSWTRLGQANGRVSVLTFMEEQLYVGGRFLQIDSVSANNIARWDGTAWQLLGSGLDGAVDVIASGQGQLIVTGEFARAGAISANSIALLRPV